MRYLELPDRSPVHAAEAMACASQPLAAQTAIDVLNAGGKAENGASNMHGFRPFSGRHRNQRVSAAYLNLMMKTSFGGRR